ncbi:MAG: hypothetical protein ABR539_12650 [Halomonas sp.]
MKKTVSERAMMSRINRKLSKEGKKLYKTPEHSKNRNDLGRFHIMDEFNGKMSQYGIERLDNLAYEMGTLKPGEEVVVE